MQIREIVGQWDVDRGILGPTTTVLVGVQDGIPYDEETGEQLSAAVERLSTSTTAVVIRGNLWGVFLPADGQCDRAGISVAPLE